MKRMLVYGNYNSESKDLEKDSLIEVLRHTLPYLYKHYKIQFTILLPMEVQSLKKPYIEQKIYHLTNNMNYMRLEFDTNQFMNVVDPENVKYDYIYTHQPEHTLQISNLFKKHTNQNPKIIGYAHWVEVKENTSYRKEDNARAMYEWLMGILQMEECGVNSEWFKQKVLSQAKEICNNRVMKQLDKKLQVHYLGIDRVKKRDESKVVNKTIMFNHRDEDFTGSKWFIKSMNELWKERQDFKVYTTLNWKRDYGDWHHRLDISDKDEYMEKLSTMKFGVGCFRNYSAWSISTTDGLSVGVPYLLPKRLCYPEMVGEYYPHYYNGKKDFRNQFIKMLDEPIEIDTTKLVKNYRWKDRIPKWFDGWKVIS